MIVINVVNIYPIITGKHDPTMSGKLRPAIDIIVIVFHHLKKVDGHMSRVDGDKYPEHSWII